MRTALSNELFTIGCTLFLHRGTLSQSDYHYLTLWYRLKLLTIN